MITFDQLVSFNDDQANEFSFHAVLVMASLGDAAVTSTYKVCPVLQVPSPICLVLKQFKLNGFRDAMLSLETELQKLKMIHHPNIINVLEFRMTSAGDEWQIDVLTDFASKGSLTEMLQMVDTITIHKAKSFIIELLEALSFYHKNGIIHGRLHAGNVLFCRSSPGIITLKLADAGLPYTLQNVNTVARDRSKSMTKDNWRPPEHSSIALSTPTRKSDVWDFGVVLVQMLFGLDITQKCSSPSNLINGADLSDALDDLIREVFHIDPKKRPNAIDIIPHEFLRTDAPVLSSLKTIEYVFYSKPSFVSKWI